MASKYKVILEICDNKLGEVHGAGEYKIGKQVSIHAVARDGYAFDGWFEGEKLIDNRSEFSFTMTNKPIFYTAKFKIEINQNFIYTLLDDGTYRLDSLKNRSITEIVIPDYFSAIGDIDCYNLYKVQYNGTIAQWCSISGLENLFSHSYRDNVCLYISGEEISGNLVIPEGVTNIANGAFNKCRMLTSVTISDGVISIGNYAFYACDNLTIVNIPNSVISIGDGAFSGCKSLSNITISNQLINIGNAAFSYCEKLVNISMPNSVRKIGRYAFYYCINVKSILLPDRITIIDSGTFGHCYSLANIKLPERLTSIGKEAFYNCTGLNNVIIPNKVINISDWAFSNCMKLANITIGCNVMNIGSGAFLNCGCLDNISMPNRLLNIGSEAFAGCERLTGATFNNAFGWYLVKSENDLGTIDINTNDALQNAKYLTDTYKSYVWKCK